MTSFTMGTQEMLQEMLGKLPDVYQVSLNRSDMESLVWYLATSVGFISTDEIPEDIQERAEGLFSSIAETLDIEGI